MDIKLKISLPRIFILAIFLSFLWHIFWLSIIKVVVIPNRTEPVKFSKVSFLGPILERSAIELRVEPKDRSFLEKRYLSAIKKLPSTETGTGKDLREEPNKDFDFLHDEKLSGLIDEAVGGPKLEPIWIVD